MDAKFNTRTVALTLGLSGLLWVAACSSGESLEVNPAQNNAGSSSTTDPSCETVQCFRAIECVEYCGGPVVQSSCCPCADGTLDELTECNDTGGAGHGSGGSLSSGGVSGSGGVAGAAGTHDDGEGGHGTGEGGGAGAPVVLEPDLSQLHSNCVDDACPAGLTPLSYYGFAGPSGPLFCSCEIPCEESPDVCPPTTTCVVVSDGPGAVCALE